jgi:hypothetical protein
MTTPDVIALITVLAIVIGEAINLIGRRKGLIR